MSTSRDDAIINGLTNETYRLYREIKKYRKRQCPDGLRIVTIMRAGYSLPTPGGHSITGAMSDDIAVPSWTRLAVHIAHNIASSDYVQEIVTTACEQNKELGTIGATREKVRNFLIKLSVRWFFDDKLTWNRGRQKKVVNSFVKHMLGEPVETKINLFLLNIWVPHDVRISKDILFRRYEVDDFHNLQTVEGLHADINTLMNISSVLEVSADCVESRDINDRAFKILFLISLFKPVFPWVAIRTHQCADISDTINDIARQQELPEYLPSNWDMSYEDMAPFKKFMGLLKDVEADEAIYREKGPNINKHFFPYKHYTDALLAGHNISRLSSAVIGLESLAVLKDERGISSKLRLRLSKLLPAIDDNLFDPIKIHEKMKKAYQARSDYVHTSLSGYQNVRKLQNKLNDLCLRTTCPVISIADCLRILLLLSIYNDGLEDIIKLADDALLSSDTDKELRKLLRKKAKAVMLTLQSELVHCDTYQLYKH